METKFRNKSGLTHLHSGVDFLKVCGFSGRSQQKYLTIMLSLIFEIIILILLWICQFLLVFLWFLMCSLPFLDSLSAGLATLQWFTSSGVDPILAQVFVTATSRTCFVNMLRKHIIINSLNIPHFISSLSWCPCNVEVLNC